MRPRTILVVDDEPQIRRAVRTALAADDVRVVDAATAADALASAAADRPELVVLDLGLPDRPGIEVCRDLRGFTDSPVLVLSARHSDDEKVALLDAGADDYLTKPFSTSELRARVRALLRRSARTGGSAETIIQSGGLRIDLAARIVTVRAAPVHVTSIEWELLRVLAVNAGRVLTHQQIFTQVWGNHATGDVSRYLRVHMAHLRRKIEDDTVHPRYLLTELGVGYRFVVLPPDSA